MAKKTETSAKLAGGITEDQLNAWKQANPEGIHVLDVEVAPAEKDENGRVTKEKETAAIYLKDPFNKPEVITEAMGKDSKHEMMEYVLGALFLGGDKDKVFKNKKARYWASVKAYNLIEVNEVVIKKA